MYFEQIHTVNRKYYTNYVYLYFFVLQYINCSKNTLIISKIDKYE